MKESRTAGRFVFFPRRPRASFALVGNSIAESGLGSGGICGSRAFRATTPWALLKHGLSGREILVSSKRLKH
jgi:hypothetical protein